MFDTANEQLYLQGSLCKAATARVTWVHLVVRASRGQGLGALTIAAAAMQFVRDYYSIEHHEAWAGKMAKDVEQISNIHYKFAGRLS